MRPAAVPASGLPASVPASCSMTGCCLETRRLLPGPPCSPVHVGFPAAALQVRRHCKGACCPAVQPVRLSVSGRMLLASGSPCATWQAQVAHLGPRHEGNTGAHSFSLFMHTMWAGTGAAGPFWCPCTAQVSWRKPSAAWLPCMGLCTPCVRESQSCCWTRRRGDALE